MPGRAPKRPRRTILSPRKVRRRTIAQNQQGTATTTTTTTTTTTSTSNLSTTTGPTSSTRVIEALPLSHTNDDDMEILFPLGDPQTWRGNKRQTSPRLTKYEATVILQRRAEQLDFNAPPLIDIKQFLEDRSPHGTIDPITIAQQELFENRLQMTVERVLPDGDIEYWNVQDLWQHTPT